MPELVWYSPSSNELLIMPFGECREYKSCRWDKCYFVKITNLNHKYYYIGEL